MSDKILPFKKPEKHNKDIRKPNQPPLINLPFVTKALLMIMIGIHAVVVFALSESLQRDVYLLLGFVPNIWTSAEISLTDWPYVLFTPVTYMFLHGGWMHLLMNCAMLMAFGSGVEQWLGQKKFLLFFLLCGIASVLTELLINPYSLHPVVGASGALSGLFAAILILLQSQGRLPTGQYGIWPFAAFWIGISLLFGLMGSAFGQGNIAWATHLGGFIMGFVLLRTRYFST